MLAYLSQTLFGTAKQAGNKPAADPVFGKRVSDPVAVQLKDSASSLPGKGQATSVLDELENYWK